MIATLSSSSGDPLFDEETRMFYILVHEAWGLAGMTGKDQGSRVALQIGLSTASTSLQPSRLPLWNEILEAPVPPNQLPCRATLVFYHHCSSNEAESAAFELLITSCLDHGFGDEWLVASTATATATNSSCSSSHSDEDAQTEQNDG
eukprot:CAMPEP_0172175962 /NCGR_PEP_ID=MMETSP1050-20130122/14531_1 /TAXON_ID=233186 /ORGANISM="Cryptomonas curvata, Strain CCAP979/52" /LENGTH=146 /DNA_ID=CAMNT_0012848147 /DNA_START=179 /DNA_END=615 /DNA_ORIENTATION=-